MTNPTKPTTPASLAERIADLCGQRGIDCTTRHFRDVMNAVRDVTRDADASLASAASVREAADGLRQKAVEAASVAGHRWLEAQLVLGKAIEKYDAALAASAGGHESKSPGAVGLAGDRRNTVGAELRAAARDIPAPSSQAAGGAGPSDASAGKPDATGQDHIGDSNEMVASPAGAEGKGEPEMDECESCLGSGRIQDADENGRPITRNCLDCRGSGEVPMGSAEKRPGKAAPPHPSPDRGAAEHGLTFARLRDVNTRRCPLFGHGLNAWNALEWAGAMCGEAGEAANAAKKIRRLADGCSVNAPDRATLVESLAGEIADVLIYADLLAASEGIELAAAVAKKFDEVSQRVGFTEKLAALPVPGGQAAAWRGIESAPKDGKLVDLWAGKCRFADCKWTDGEWMVWMIPDGGEEYGWYKPTFFVGHPPTHWQPLPALPARPAEGGEQA